jgi:hypothetical protein
MAIRLKVVRGKQFDAFSAACRDLMKITGQQFETVLRHEVGKVLEITIDRTKKATPQKVMRNFFNQKMTSQDIAYGGPETRSNNPNVRERLMRQAGQRRGKSTNGKLKYALPPFVGGKHEGGGAGRHKHPSWLWDELRQRRAKSLKDKISRAGVSAKHWLEIANILGIPVKAPSRVRNAQNKKPFAVKASTNGTLRGMNFVIQGQNFGRISVNEAGGDKALRSAIRSRVTFFKSALKKDAKSKVNIIARRYPDLMKAA